jgi:PIN domain nuclease of toxin-antitoxin system
VLNHCRPIPSRRKSLKAITDLRYLLDTAAWTNDVLRPEVIPIRIRRLVDTDETKGLCSVSLLEAAIHQRHGRLLSRTATLQEFFDRALKRDIELLELTPAVAIATNELPREFPGDPFDRTIAATAKVLNLTLITTDPAIRDAQFCKVAYYPFRPERAGSKS